MSKYEDVEFEISKKCHLKRKTILIDVGALGMIKEDTGNFVDQISGKPTINETRKNSIRINFSQSSRIFYPS